MGLLRQLAHRLLSEERDSEFGYFDYVAAQKRVEQMSMVNEDIQSLEDMIDVYKRQPYIYKFDAVELFYFLKSEKWLTCDAKCGILIKSVREVRTKVYRGMEQLGSSSGS